MLKPDSPSHWSRGRKLCLLFVGLIGIFSSALRAQELPDAIHVADRIGQVVEFQDEVKAVSYSRSTHGTHQSFGAPYPAQVLPVWMSHENYEHLPGRHALVGRTVRIKGLLEANPESPLLKLDSPASFKLLPVDEAALSKSVLDGKMDRNQFRSAVMQKLVAEEFGTLEVVAELAKSCPRSRTILTWKSG